jgi:cell fate regulator YaaT (PSP1 superfamily)
MCCLSYEHDNYVETKKRLPSIGDLVMTPKGQGRVVDLNIIKEDVHVLISESQVQVVFPATDVKAERTQKCSSCHGCSVGSLKEQFKEASYSEAEPEELDLSELED